MTENGIGDGIADPDEWQAYKRRPTVFSFMVRGRIRAATEQMHGIIIERLRVARVQGDVATEAGLIDELREVGRAKRDGTEQDLRAALLSVGATVVLLAERADRGEEPVRGRKRSTTERWQAPDYRVNREESI